MINMDDHTFQNRILPRLLQVHQEPLDPNVIAAYVGGTLSEEEKGEAERRLAADPEAALLVRALREDLVDVHGEDAMAHGPPAPASTSEAAARPERVVGGWWASAAAAIALFAVGLVAFQLGPTPRRVDLQTRLTRATRELGQVAPEHFASFTPLEGSELQSLRGAARGGVIWLGPRGVVLEAPREFRWRNPEDGERAEVRLVGPTINWKREVRGNHVAAPELGPGRYVITIRSLDSLAAQSTRRTFEIADAESIARHARAMALIREHAPRDIADVLLAHYAIRSRLLDHARKTIAQSSSRDPAVHQAMEGLARYVEEPRTSAQ
jgi:hypothetical protein